MASAMNTLAGVLNLGDANIDFEVTNLLQDTPVLARLVAVPSSHGLSHKYLRETVAASVGFRAINTGLTNTASQDEVVTVPLEFLDASWEDDVAIVKAMATGKGGADAYVSRRAIKSIKAAMVGIEKQWFYGTGQDAGGFAGLEALTQTAMTTSAGGTTADEQTSAYFVRTGEEDAAIVYNGDNNGTIEVDEVRKSDVAEGSGKYSTYRQDIDGYLGAQAGNIYTLGRIANIEASLTDAMISAQLALFPAGKGPDFIAMTRKAQELLRASRTATNPTGAPAPFPDEAFGVPIVITDQIVETEAIVV